MSTPEIDFDQFLAVDMRVGRLTAVEDFPEARKPAWKLTIDFGEEIGTKRSSAQITNYSREELEGHGITVSSRDRRARRSDVVRVHHHPDPNWRLRRLAADVRPGPTAGTREGEAAAFRGVEDPNHVFIVLDFESVEDAQESRQRLLDSGVLDRFEDKHGPNVVVEVP